jgi:hypothetical protein
MYIAFWYFSGNFAPVPNTVPVGHPIPIFTDAGNPSA